MRIFGIILAGGEEPRIGGVDKALLPFNGATLLDQSIARLLPQVEELALSANGDLARFGRFGLTVLPDAESRGPLSGILSGLLWAQGQGADAVVSVPVDVPFLPGDLLPRLVLAGEASGGLALASSGGRLHPACALWPVGLAGALASFLASGAKERVTDFAKAHGAAMAEFPDDGAFANLNTPEDLAAAEALTRGEA